MPHPNQKGRGGRGGPPSREVTVSKALSYLLRHAAEREGLKIDSRGYANVKDVLAWRKLKSLKVTFPEIIAAVETSDKKRFALFYRPPSSTTDEEPPSLEPEEPAPEPETENETTTATTQALTHSQTDQTPSHYLIRATQGHSIKSVEAESLLEKLTLDSPDKLPETVVHGTFHSVWPKILSSGGLRCMGRNHAHFATGPAVADVLGAIQATSAASASKDDNGNNNGENFDTGSKGKVISGMRQDAQVLVYINLRKALEGGCPFWRSENGVILSEGKDVSGEGEGGGGEGKLIPVEFFDVVVERRRGLGVIWEKGEVVQTLPEELTRRGGGGKGSPKEGGKKHRESKR
ncbi:KptA family-domain-containing protein [Aspergillus cavernicola]|uniref:2'-phosphotransferase n=1 Tax=Aspergillus cavernicola TaxID=176166 RepID=A0ABR4HV30_9EURO